MDSGAFYALEWRSLPFLRQVWGLRQSESGFHLSGVGFALRALALLEPQGSLGGTIEQKGPACRGGLPLRPGPIHRVHFGQILLSLSFGRSSGHTYGKRPPVLSQKHVLATEGRTSVEPLKDACDPLPPSYAGGYQPVLLIPSPKLVEDLYGELSPCAAEGMSQSDGTSIDIEFL